MIILKQLTLYEAFQQEQYILDNFKKDRFKIPDMKQYKETGWTECFPLSMLSTLEQEFINTYTT